MLRQVGLSPTTPWMVLLSLLLMLSPVTSQPPGDAPVAVEEQVLQLDAPIKVGEHQLVVVECSYVCEQVFIQVQNLESPVEPVEIKSLDGSASGQWSWTFTGPPGDYVITIVAFTPAEPYQTTQVLVNIEGEKPDPGPDDPDIPPLPPPGDCDEVAEDSFDNIGQRACGWKPSGDEVSRALGGMYALVARNLEDGTYLDIGDSNERLRELKASILNTPALEQSWSVWTGKVRDDLQARGLDRVDLVTYYRALAAGLEH